MPKPSPSAPALPHAQQASLDAPHPGGLLHDLEVMHTRRQALRWLGGVGSWASAGVLLSACGGGDTGSADPASTSSSSTTTTTSSSSASGSSTSSCSVVPEETQGPYPGDGSNTANGSLANALALSGIVRSDIRNSVGSASGTASGVPVKLVIQLVNVNNGCAVLDGYAIYLWHCDAQGRYSMYSSGVTSENYLRGVQPTDSSGQATFQTIFPGCYSGRMPHMHFEVYRSTNTATSFSNKLKTSQLAFPNEVSAAVYNSDSRYSASISNFAKISFASDNIFSDGYSLEMTSMSGDATNGYTATITIGISV